MGEARRIGTLGVLGLVMALSVWALLTRPMPVKGRLGFLVLLLILVAALTIGADFGGRMVSTTTPAEMLVLNRFRTGSDS